MKAEKLKAIKEKVAQGTAKKKHYRKLMIACIEENQFTAALSILQTWEKHKGSDKETEYLREEISFWHSLGAQLLPVHKIRANMGLENDGSDQNSTVLGLYVHGDVSMPRDLSLDYQLGFDLYLTYYPVFIHGNLKVGGSIINYCANSGLSLTVSGDVRTEYLIGGGSIIKIIGHTTATCAVIGYYNDGEILLEKVTTPIFWCEGEHVMYYNFSQSEIGHNIFDTEHALDLLHRDLRESVLKEIRKDFAEEIEEEGEEDALVGVDLYQSYIEGLCGEVPFDEIFSL